MCLCSSFLRVIDVLQFLIHHVFCSVELAAVQLISWDTHSCFDMDSPTPRRERFNPLHLEHGGARCFTIPQDVVRCFYCLSTLKDSWHAEQAICGGKPFWGNLGIVLVGVFFLQVKSTNKDHWKTRLTLTLTENLLWLGCVSAFCIRREQDTR